MSDALIEAVARAICADMFPDRKDAWAHVDRKRILMTARAAIAAIEGAGYRIVPVVATEDMQYAGYDTHYDVSDGGDWAPIERWPEIVNAIIAAAPKVLP